MRSPHFSQQITEPFAAHNEGRAVLSGDLDVMLAALMCELGRSATLEGTRTASAHGLASSSADAGWLGIGRLRSSIPFARAVSDTQPGGGMSESVPEPSGSSQQPDRWSLSVLRS